MSLLTILETLLLGPLKLIFEIIFSIANRLIGHPGLAIVALSLIMNLLVLPLYRRADAMQEAARDTEAKLHNGIAHIKKVFSGDERMMVLQTYYRQNQYSPLSALNGSVSLLLEIPFFMAAYQFLSNLKILDGVSLGPITDLSAPDGLLQVGGIAINLLPIIMTLVNVISSAIYLKGFPLKTKIQLYAMALFFLVFLYQSPACLVFYWTLNNVFSLVKTIVYKWKETVASRSLPDKTERCKKEVKPNRRLFVMGALFLTALVGLLIPSTFIAASPQEYVDITYFHHPLWYIVSTVCLAAGTFLIWMGVFYWLASPKGKVIFEKLVWILSGAMLVNYMFFGTDLGIISAALQYERGLSFSTKEQLLNLGVLIVLAFVMCLVVSKWNRAVRMVLLTAGIAIVGMSVWNIVQVKDSVSQISAHLYAQDGEDAIPNFEISKDGKNIVVLMLDRAMGEYIPYIMHENPQLQEQFAGFTYYDNVISFGGFTNFGVPPLLGGYEYTPVEMNKREQETLVSKHNEALKVMPTIFGEQGFQVTMCDPVYANYEWIPDLSVLDGIPNTKSYITKGQFGDATPKEKLVKNNHRNFFCFSIMKSMPLCLQRAVYNNGHYNQVATLGSQHDYTVQTVESLTKAKGLSANFMESYHVMTNLPNMTRIVENDKNNFLFLSNDATHEPMLLQLPEYKPAVEVDNSEYESVYTNGITLDGRTLRIGNKLQAIHYQSNVAVLMQVGEWLDYLRRNDVYDNTRIIIVSDHAGDYQHLEEFEVEGIKNVLDKGRYYPLLLVKDFGSGEFVTSHEFMTNADVPLLAMKDLIENPKNPFTGKEITNEEKYSHEQLVILSASWDVSKNNGNTFLASGWASVKDSLWNSENWKFYNEEIILKEHSLPK